MTQFRDITTPTFPPWLSTGDAERYTYVVKLMLDLLNEKANQAQKIRMPGQGDVSQIPYLAHDRQLVQGPNESNASFVLRLQEAFATWAAAGSAPAVLEQIQTYTQGFQPGVDPSFPLMRIVSNPRELVGGSEVNSWWTLLQGDPIGTFPALATVPKDFDWDGNDAATWRCWLILYQYAPTPLASSGAAVTTTGGGSFTEPGQNVAGVWVPTTSGTPVNAPFVTLTGLSGLDDSNVGDVITLSGSANPTNNGTFQIVEVLSSTSAVIVNTDAVAPDAGPLTWGITRYPWIPPGLAWGSPGVWGEGEATLPPVDTGSNVQGMWKPTALAGVGERPTYAWGLRTSPLTIETIRGLVKQWKSNGTYYPNIIICYDGGDGATGTSCYTPWTLNNPSGTFGDVGGTEDGVWIPTRRLDSPWNAFCQGTGVALACGAENVT